VYLLSSRRAFTAVIALSVNAILLSSCGDGVVIAENQSGTDLLDQQLRQRIQTTAVTGDLERDRTLPWEEFVFHHWARWRS
jgi:hypothetical protein